MKTVLLTILASIIPMIEAVGAGMAADTAHPQQEVIGEGLVFAGQLIQFLLDKAHGKTATAPTLPASIYPTSSEPNV